MKKIFGVFVLTVVICGFTACGNSKSSNGQQAENESVKEVETTDTIVTRGGSESEGFGRCLESGCYCKEFKGRGQTCQNCGHAYRRHY